MKETKIVEISWRYKKCERVTMYRREFGWEGFLGRLRLAQTESGWHASLRVPEELDPGEYTRNVVSSGSIPLPQAQLAVIALREQVLALATWFREAGDELRCGTCDTCELERIGCGCDGAHDDGCWICRPAQHERPLCPDQSAAARYETFLERSDNCPRCGKSNWAGDKGCCCRITPTTVQAIFLGDLVEAHTDHERPERRHVTGRQVTVTAKLCLRRDLYHFAGGLRMHLDWSTAGLARCDHLAHSKTG